MVVHGADRSVVVGAITVLIMLSATSAIVRFNLVHVVLTMLLVVFVLYITQTSIAILSLDKWHQVLQDHTVLQYHTEETSVQEDLFADVAMDTLYFLAVVDLVHLLKVVTVGVTGDRRVW
tara:strand:+ start:3955 stop:4314 length:360 start_codon:yes stop_codon:yes gene_type:complete